MEKSNLIKEHALNREHVPLTYALVVVLGIQALSFKEATSTLFAIFIMKLKRFSHQLNFKNNGPVFFLNFYW